MTPDTLQLLIADRLEHLADRVEHLCSVGKTAEARLLREEGLALAASYDNEDLFLFIGDLQGA